MNLLPSPLHPALVHFPIVLILLGAAVSVIAVFTARWHLRTLVAAILTLGALGTAAAVATGDEDGEAVERAPAISALLEEHEEWAERTEGFAIGAAVLAIAAALARRWPAVGRTLSIAGAAGALAASVCVYETGHRGGQLVYRHAAGVNLAPAEVAGGTEALARPERRSHRDDRDHDRR